MKSTFAKLGLLAALGGIVFVGQNASANLTGHGAAFHNYNANQALDIDFVGQGVRNISTSGVRPVIASVPFSWSSTANGNIKFSIEGKNPAGVSTVFSLQAWNQGTVRSSVGFTTGPGAGTVGYYVAEQTLNTLDKFSRVFVLASLQPNINAVVYGVTQIQ